MPRRRTIIIEKQADAFVAQAASGQQRDDLMDAANPLHARRFMFQRALRQKRQLGCATKPLTAQEEATLNALYIRHRNSTRRSEKNELKEELAFLLFQIHGLDRFEFGDGTVAEIVANPKPPAVRVQRRTLPIEEFASPVRRAAVQAGVETLPAVTVRFSEPLQGC
jgi:hypothetical protein